MAAIVRSDCKNCGEENRTPFKQVMLEIGTQTVSFDCCFCDTTQHYYHLPDELFYALLRHPHTAVYYHPRASDLEKKPPYLPDLTLDHIIDFHFAMVELDCGL